MEHEVQADIDAGNVLEFENIEDFIEYLDKVEDAED